MSQNHQERQLAVIGQLSKLGVVPDSRIDLAVAGHLITPKKAGRRLLGLAVGVQDGAVAAPAAWPWLARSLADAWSSHPAGSQQLRSSVDTAQIDQPES